jgi:hypothetical protein
MYRQTKIGLTGVGNSNTSKNSDEVTNLNENVSFLKCVRRDTLGSTLGAWRRELTGMIEAFRSEDPMARSARID